MRRYASIRCLACWLLLPALALPAHAARYAGSRPNIVLILADDLGYGDLGVYGHPTIRTPNLDRMAREGMQLMQFYSASSLCSPSRAALMTGRLPVRFGMNAVLPPVTNRGMPDSELTMGEALQRAGYLTSLIGKWHLGRKRRYLPLYHGFHRFFGLPYSNDMSRKNNPKHPIYRLRVVPPLPLIEGIYVIEQEPDQSLLTQRFTEHALRFMRFAVEVRKQPFFLYLAHIAPHPPLHPGERFRGRSPRGLYGDVVEELDWSVGKVLAEIRRLGIDEETLVVFTSDNGPWLAKKEHGGSPGPFREGKGSTWEGGVRMPFIARWPGRIPAGVKSRAFVTMMDLLPTFAALAGVELPDDRVYDGRDVSDVLFENAPGREPRIFLWIRQELRAYRRGAWKLHVITNYPANGTRKTTIHDPPLLYNVEQDPGERFDVAAEHPDIVKRMLADMEAHRIAVFKDRKNKRPGK